MVLNVRAIYAHSMGPYDGNPAHLHPLPPSAAGAKYVQYMGGADAAVARAQQDFETGEFRWVVEVMQHVIFSDPDHVAARALAADAMEQLAYQAESSTWRNAYLLGARELRQRRAPSAHQTIPISADMVSLLQLNSFLEFLAIRVHGLKAQDLQACFDWTLEAGDGHPAQQQRLTLSHGALSHLPGAHPGVADATLRFSRAQMAAMLQGPEVMLRMLDAGELAPEGDAALLRRFMETLDSFDPMFNVVEP